MDRRRYSTMLVLAAAALVAEACSSSNGNKGTGGADGGSSTGGVTGTGGKTDGGTGGVTGTGGKVDAGTGGMGTGGKVDAGDSGTGGMGTGGKVDAGDSGTDTPTDTPITDSGADADPAASEKMMCTTQAMYQSNITTTPFTAAQFCTLYFSICNDLGGVTHFANETACEAAYNGYNMTPDADMSPTGQQGCRTYHLCNAVRIGVNPHCAHATGFSSFDGSVGPPCP